jgi:hypothetical protein
LRLRRDQGGSILARGGTGRGSPRRPSGRRSRDHLSVSGGDRRDRTSRARWWRWYRACRSGRVRAPAGTDQTRQGGAALPRALDATIPRLPPGPLLAVGVGLALEARARLFAAEAEAAGRHVAPTVRARACCVAEGEGEGADIGLDRADALVRNLAAELLVCAPFAYAAAGATIAAPQAASPVDHTGWPPRPGPPEPSGPGLRAPRGRSAGCLRESA